MLHAGGRQVRPGALLVTPRVHVLLLRFDFQHSSLPRPSATSGTKDLPNLSGCFRVSRAVVNKGRQIVAEPISDRRSLPNVASFSPQKSRGKMPFIGCVVPGNVENSHAESPAATDQSGIDLQDSGPSLALEPFLGKLCCHCIR